MITESKIKIKTRYHLTPVRRAIIKKSTNKKGGTGHGEKGTLLRWFWEGKLVPGMGENSMEVCLKT